HIPTALLALIVRTDPILRDFRRLLDIECTRSIELIVATLLGIWPGPTHHVDRARQQNSSIALRPGCQSWVDTLHKRYRSSYCRRSKARPTIHSTDNSYIGAICRDFRKLTITHRCLGIAKHRRTVHGIGIVIVIANR